VGNWVLHSNRLISSLGVGIKGSASINTFCLKENKPKTYNQSKRLKTSPFSKINGNDWT
jgi:hypothetical protein